MNRILIIMGAFCLIIMNCSCGSYESEKSKILYTGIERTLALLNSSTKESPNEINILFYGQSIIEQIGADILIDSLKNKFPTAIINYKEKAIGSFTVPLLINTAEHDLYQDNPDLIVFHAYGGLQDNVLDKLIHTIRKRMTSDVLLLDHHYVWSVPQSALTKRNKRDSIGSVELKRIAKKYHCSLVNVREKWKEYLDSNNIGANVLVGNTIDPNVHPNDAGNKLLRKIVLSKFVKQKDNIYKTQRDSLREIIVLEGTSKSFTYNITANRVDITVDTKPSDDAYLEVLIDNKRPSEFKNTYVITRPSSGFGSNRPALSKVVFGEIFPREEEWIVEITDINRENQSFKYKLISNIVGFDGRGNSEADFISDSKRININPKDFNIFKLERQTKKLTPLNFQIKFKAEALIQDTIILASEKNRYRLFRDFDSEDHHIEINVLNGNPKPQQLLISRPFLRTNEK